MLSRFVREAFAARQKFSTKAVAMAEVKPEQFVRSESKSKPCRDTSTSTTVSSSDTLGRRIFSLVYAKRSAVITIQKWKEEGHVVRKYELNRIVRELRRLKRYKHALEVCEWMKIQEDMKLVPGDFAVHLDLVAKIRGVNSAEKFFEDLPDKMRDSTTCNALLHTYVQHQMSSNAEALMKKMSECDFLKNPLPYNHMLSLHIATSRLEKVPELIQELKKTTSPDVVTYNLWLSACASQNLLETAEKVFTELSKSKNEPDWMTYSTMTSIYIKNSLQEQAQSMLKEMEKKISVKERAAHSSLISLHTGLGNTKDIFRIWKMMKSTYRRLSDAEYTCMIASLLKLNELEEAEKLFEEWESKSPTKDSRVPNLLISYFINNNQMDKAEAALGKMVEKNFVPSYTTWELLTWGYLKQNKVEKAIESFKRAVATVKRWSPNQKLVEEVFKIVEGHGDVDRAEQLVVTLRDAEYLNLEVYKSLIRTYEKAGKMPLIMAERMAKDKIQMDDEIKSLILTTSKMCVGEIPSSI